MKSLKGTETAKNLMKAFAGESQARNRYNYFASIARKEGYIQIYNIFNETADNEKEHAKRFFKFLRRDYEHEAVMIEADFPVSLGDTLDNLDGAAQGEHEEWSALYPDFAKVAKEEGFEDIAAVFNEVASVEKHHEERFKKLYENIKNDKVFRKDNIVKWKCNNCGYIHEGNTAPEVCPACAHPQGFFEVLCDNF